MTRSRRHPALAAALLATIALAGCEKPFPSVTTWSGTSSFNERAVCWQHDRNKVLGSADCSQDLLNAASAGSGVPHIEVAPGGTVGISVDREVAEGGWSVLIGGQAIAEGLRTTYFRFTFPQQVAAGGSSYLLQVTAAAAPTGTRGYWFFQLVTR